MTLGKVWLVGAGPGDPGLITVRGLEVLRRAEVVLIDALVHPALLDHCPSAEIRNVGKRYGQESTPQDTINQQLIALGRAGKRVVRLKGGDPLMFARGGEEALALAAAGVPFEIVPGVSSPVAASAYAGIPLTHRDLSSSVTFITGSDRAGVEWSPEAWKKLSTATDTICVLMGMRRIEEITRAILDGGRSPSTPVAVIHWGARSQQRVAVAPLGEIAEVARARGLKNPAVIVVGDVVALRERIAWFDRQPLFGKRLALFRPEEQARQTAHAVRERGAEPLLFPLIAIADPPDRSALEAAIRELPSYGWVLFTSANGVTRFFAALGAAGRDARALGAARVGVIGPKTGAALAPFGIHPDVTAEEFVGEGLARALLAAGPPSRVLVPRALVAREALPEVLRAHGFTVDVVPAYETRSAGPAVRERLRAAIDAGEIDAALFTSSSTVTETVRELGDDAASLLGRVVVASIGPITTQTLERFGIHVDVSAERYTVDGALDALERYYARSTNDPGSA
ncbi:MAG TPA: uroporphyrinogen-III C-methyltransferase [Polyangiaceae bacterium]|nr:uroporphyrinogen-III C-methyltransferase [Polyangiaceae bacterium]